MNTVGELKIFVRDRSWFSEVMKPLDYPHRKGAFLDWCGTERPEAFAFGIWQQALHDQTLEAAKTLDHEIGTL